MQEEEDASEEVSTRGLYDRKSLTHTQSFMPPTQINNFLDKETQLQSQVSTPKNSFKQLLKPQMPQNLGRSSIQIGSNTGKGK